MTLVSDSHHRPPRVADRIAARTIARSLDPHSTPEEISAAALALAGGDLALIEQAARRVRLDLVDRPTTAAGRALAVLEGLGRQAAS